MSRGTYSDILKFISLFRNKGLLEGRLYYQLKEDLLSGRPDLLQVFAPYDLSLLSEAGNISHLSDLFNKVEEYGLSLTKSYLNPFFDEETLIEAHQLANKCTLSQKKDGDSRNYVYGEVEYEAFQAILEIALTGMKKDRLVKFVDLGSGLGKACFWTALTTPFSQIHGIEIIDRLLLKSKYICDKIQRDFRRRDMPDTIMRSVSLVQGNFLKDQHRATWIDADVILANSTCFTEALMDKIAKMSTDMRKGARFISFTYPLKSDEWKILYRQQLAMSWGPATVFIQERL